MSIIGIGVDLLHFPRIAALVERRGQHRFVKRVLSHAELRRWVPHANNSLRYLAVRFAVKEAAYKALYPTVRPTWKELSFMSYGELFPGSKPQLTYESLNATEGELGKIERLRLHVSVSHDGEYIAATVLAESSTS